MKLNYFLSVFVLFAMSINSSYAQDLPIIPYPQEVNMIEGNLDIREGFKIYLDKSLTKETCYFISELNKLQVTSEIVSDKNQANLILSIKLMQKDDKKESYDLVIGDKVIKIMSTSKEGFFYGIQSLLQLVANNRSTLPQAIIHDYPAYAWRSFMLDEGRYFKGEKVVKQLLDEMALLKMNIFHWHLTEDQGWRIEIKKYPKLTEVGAFRDSTQMDWYESNDYDGVPHGGYYSQKQIKEIIEYAADRNITIVPEIEMPGHSAAAIAAYPWLGAENKEISVPTRFGVQYDVFNVADPKVRTFLKDVLSEVIDLFPSPVIHIGGDEVRYDQWIESQQVQNFIKEKELDTPANLQVWFTNYISQFIKNKNRRMMGWNDITGDKLHHFHEESKVKEPLAEGTIVQFWKGDNDLLIQAAQAGHDIVNSTNDYTYLNYSYVYDSLEATYEFQPISLEKAYHFSPIPDNFPKDLSHKIIGGGCQMWGEWIPTEESMNKRLYPRIAALAEAFWTKSEKQDYLRFIQNMENIITRWEELGYSYGPLDVTE